MTGHMPDQKGQHRKGWARWLRGLQDLRGSIFLGQASLEWKEREETQEPLHLNSGSPQSEMHVNRTGFGLFHFEQKTRWCEMSVNDLLVLNVKNTKQNRKDWNLGE